MNMIMLPKQFKPVAPGKKIGICAPSARFNSKKLASGIKQLESLGFILHVPEDIFDKKRYLAGQDKKRAQVVNQLFSDPDISAIICARGGFGALRMLEFIEFDMIRANPKPFIGFSDITALHLAILDRAGMPVIHGPNVVSLDHGDESTLNSLKSFLTSPSAPGYLECERLIGTKVQGHTITGKLKGGNISTISHMLGTPFAPDFHDSILFLEEINEPAYKIDRMLTQMRLADCFKNVKAVVTGSFETCDFPEYIDDILAELSSDLQIPVLTGACCGHGRVNLSLPMGIQISMDLDGMRVVWNDQ